jgi:hypothetical protein
MLALTHRTVHYPLVRRLSNSLSVAVLVALAVTACTADEATREGCGKGASCGTTVSDTSTSAQSQPTDTTSSSISRQDETRVAEAGEVAELGGRDWVVIEATGVGRDPKAFPAHLRFTVDGDDSGSLSVSGCAVGTLPVAFRPRHQMTVGSSQDLSVCANPFDVGQAIPNILELPLRWSVVADELTLTPTTPSDYSLVLTDFAS